VLAAAACLARVSGAPGIVAAAHHVFPKAFAPELLEFFNT
jgi:hypothetical protein